MNRFSRWCLLLLKRCFRRPGYWFILAAAPLLTLALLSAAREGSRLVTVALVLTDPRDPAAVLTRGGHEVAQATKRREKLTKQLKECREYDEKLAHLALSRIELDLDDGVKKNYRKIQTANDGKFYEVLADSKNIMSKE